MKAFDLDQQAAMQWQAIKKWKDLYLSGLRITFDGKQFQFWHNNWDSRLRVETNGGFNEFDCMLIQPTGEHVALVAEYGERWLKFFPTNVPASLKDKFFHLLSKDYEFYQLVVECEKIGVVCYGYPLDGGIFPQIKPGEAVYKESENKPYPVKPILQEYLDGYGTIEREPLPSPISTDAGAPEARGRRLQEAKEAISQSIEMERRWKKNNSKPAGK